MEVQVKILSALSLVAALLLIGFTIRLSLAGEPDVKKWRIREFTIEGADRNQIKAIKSALSLKTPSWKSHLPWEENPEFSDDMLRTDVDRIISLYRRWGYYNAQVTPKTEKNDKTREVSLSISIIPGPVAHIRSIDISGLEAVDKKHRMEILKRIVMHKGQVFTQQDYEKSKNDVSEYFANQGFAKAELRGKAVVDPKRNEASISLSLSMGRQYRFGPTTVQCPENIDPAIILSRVSFKEGDLYNLEKIKETQRSIFELGTFGVVTISPQEPDPKKPSYLPVKIVAKSRKERSVKFGLGFGTEDKVRAQLTWEHRNFFGQARNLNLTTKYSDIVESAEVRFKQPYFLGRRQFMEDKFGYQKDKMTSYTNERLFNEFLVTRKVNKPLSVGVGQNIEYNNPEGVQAETPFDISQRGTEYFISSAIGIVQFDTRDQIIDSHSGTYFKFGVEAATEALGSDIGYTKLLSEARYFTPFSYGSVLAGRITLGTIEPTEATEEVPIFKRFFSGGSNSVRGYAFQELGPKDSNGDPIGGETLVEGSLEVRYPVWRDFGGVTFVDFGNVYESPFSVDFGDIRYTSGMGVRYKTPIGPVRMDVGYQINPQSDEDSRYQVHFSIGQAF
jgi:outer membrane protein assembly complex protein YaeT